MCGLHATNRIVEIQKEKFMVADTEVDDTITEPGTEPEETTETDVEVVETPAEGAEPEHTPYEKKMFERAKKAEAELKAVKVKLNEHLATPAETQTNSNNLPQRDLIRLARPDLTDEDIDEVMDYSALKKISFVKALVTPFMKARLKDMADERKSASVANTGGSRRASSATTPEQVLDNARKGVAPKTDEDWKKLVEAQRK